MEYFSPFGRSKLKNLAFICLLETAGVLEVEKGEM
jgi:hypothetical protein